MEKREFAVYAKAVYVYSMDYVVEYSRTLYENAFSCGEIEKTIVKAFLKSVKILDKHCKLERIEFDVYPNFENDVSFYVHFTYYNYDKQIKMDNKTIKSKYLDNLYIYRKNLTPENIKTFLIIDEE